jgi:hypothetical protein
MPTLTVRYFSSLNERLPYECSLLASKFATTIDTLDIQTQLSVEDKLKHLEAKESRLKENADIEAALFAKKTTKPTYSHSHRRDGSASSSSESNPWEYKCYLCFSEHMIRDCTPLRTAQRLRKEHDRAKKIKRSSSKPKADSHGKKPSSRAKLSTRKSVKKPH